MFYFIDLKYKDSADYIKKNIGKHFPYAYNILKFMSENPCFNILELPLYHFCFLKDEEHNLLGVMVYYKGSEFVKRGFYKKSECGKIFVIVLEVGALYHGKEYGLKMIRWLQDKFHNMTIELIAKNKEIAEKYYLKRGFVLSNPYELVLKYQGGSKNE